MKEKLKIWLPIVLIGLFFLAIIVFKNDMLNYVSRRMKNEIPETIKDSTEILISQKYNYQINGLPYNYTFLEFGSVGCSACTQMEGVMTKIKEQYKAVNVIFINITKAENKNLSKYFGVASIPTQVILDKNGKEMYRHSGYISSKELGLKFN